MSKDMKNIVDNIEWIGGHLAWAAWWIFANVFDIVGQRAMLIVGIAGGLMLIYMNYQKAMKYRSERRYFDAKHGHKEGSRGVTEGENNE